VKAEVLPARYREPGQRLFDDAVARELRPGMRILDVGSGRRPALPIEHRPQECHYVGLDLSREELQRAPEGSYDEMISGDIAHFIPETAEQFDLALSWQVLEHVKPLPNALENIREYLAPSGTLIAPLSGRFSIFALINQAVPHRWVVWILARLLNRAPGTVFPAHYDHAWHGALVRAMAKWTEVDITPRYRGAVYFNFSDLLQRAYLVYEEWTMNRQHQNLASHYLLRAKK